MLEIDAGTMLIGLTRGDTASIVFVAEDDEGTEYVPAAGDKLTFAVAKKVGADPIMSITNVYAGDADAFWTIVIGSAGSDDWYQRDDNGEVVLDADGNPEYIKTGNYVWDVQLETQAGIQTIIGKTDSISPQFRVWGEVAQNG